MGLRHQIIVSLAGNVERKAESMGRAIERMERRARPAMTRMGRTTQLAGQGLDRLSNRYSAMAAGGTLLLASKQVADLDERVNQLGINASLSGDKLKGFKTDVKQQVQSAAIQYRTHSAEIFSAIEGIVERTGNLPFATSNIENIATAIRATGAAGADIGGLMAEFEKMGVADPSTVLELLDVLVVQGKQGAFTLKDLSRLGERVFAAYGPQNIQQVREMGAALQSIRTVSGSSEQATTAFEAIIRTLSDGKKAKRLARAGIKVFTDETETQLRPLNELMQEIVTASGGKLTVLGQLVEDSEARKALMGVLNELKQTGNTGELLDKLVSVQADGATLRDDAQAAGTTLNASALSIKEVLNRYADGALSEQLNGLAETLNGLDPKTVDNFTTAILGATAALIAMSISAGFIRNGKTIGGLFKGMRKGGKPKAPTPTTNLGKALGYNPKKAGLLSRAGTAIAATGSGLLATGATAVGSASVATVGATVAAGGAIGYGIGSLINKGIEGTKVSDAIGEFVAHTLALAGNDNAQAAIERQRAYEQSQQQGSMRFELAVSDDRIKTRVAEFTPPSGLDIETGSMLETL